VGASCRDPGKAGELEALGVRVRRGDFEERDSLRHAFAGAIVLADEGRWEGATPPLTGAEALDLGDLAALAADILGRPIARAEISDDDLRARVLARGAPAPAADIAVGLYRASRAGEFDLVDPALANLLGRAPQPMRAWMANALAG